MINVLYTCAKLQVPWLEFFRTNGFFSTSDFKVIIFMESIKCIEIASVQDVQNVIEFCRKYGMLLGEHFKDCEEMELSEKTLHIT